MGERSFVSVVGGAFTLKLESVTSGSGGLAAKQGMWEVNGIVLANFCCGSLVN